MEKKSYCNVNTLLQGRYVVGLAMGNNELGITYHGHDNVTNKKVAIKEYFPNGVDEEKFKIKNPLFLGDFHVSLLLQITR